MTDASGALGGRQVAGTWVNRRGTAKNLVSTMAGDEVGGAVGSSAAAQVPAGRGEVTRADLGSGTLACPLRITFSDGARWEFDVPRGDRSAAQRLVTSLGG